MIRQSLSNKNEKYYSVFWKKNLPSKRGPISVHRPMCLVPSCITHLVRFWEIHCHYSQTQSRHQAWNPSIGRTKPIGPSWLALHWRVRDGYGRCPAPTVALSGPWTMDVVRKANVYGQRLRTIQLYTTGNNGGPRPAQMSTTHRVCLVSGKGVKKVL
jgi:hypothetical protein